MSAVAIITARGGSKRIPRKNIRSFLGRPIIAYSIEAAFDSGIFAEVMVSTDDDEIADIAGGLGATVPFRRSDKTADDHSVTAAVLSEVLHTYAERGATFAHACCIYPTAPFVTAARLCEALSRLREVGADSVIAVTRFGFPVWRAFRMEGERIAYQWPEHAMSRSQDLPPAFHDAGQFYMFDVLRFLESGALVTGNTVGIEVPESQVQDIDTEEDWRLAELKYRLMKEAACQ